MSSAAPLIAPAKLLRDRGIKFDSYNSGSHLVIRRAGRVFDLWPRSQRWRERYQRDKPGSFPVHRSSVRSGCGVADLIKAIEEVKA